METMMTRKTLGLIAAAAFLIGAGQAHANDYPSRPITIIAPLAAGGGLDVMTRLLSDELGRKIGGTTVVENRAGGGTSIGAMALAKAEPDGYTLMMAPSTTMTTNLALYKSLPYAPERDFAPVALVNKVPFVLVVNAKLPIHNLEDLKKYANENPGKLSYASSGAGGLPHLAGELLKAQLGIEMVHVPYRGAAPAMNDLVSGHVHVFFSDTASALPQMELKTIRAIGLSSAEKSPALDIPPLAELGLPGFDVYSWRMFVAPAGTSPDIVKKLNAAFHAIVSDQTTRKKIEDLGVIPVVTGSVDDVRAFAAKEASTWRAVVEKAGLAGTLGK